VHDLTLITGNKTPKAKPKVQLQESKSVVKKGEENWVLGVGPQNGRLHG